MKKQSLFKLALSGLFAAIVCVMTLVAIPLPANGYANMGDCFVILSGAVLGPVYGPLAAGVGSMLSDIFLGYAVYAPATFVIKGLIGFLVGITFNRLKIKIKSKPLICLISGVISLSVMTLGYLAFELFLYGKSAFLNVPFNLVQGGFGIVVSVILLPILEKSLKEKR